MTKTKSIFETWGLKLMIDNGGKADELQRSIEVDMSRKAISRRLREAGELNELGLSLAKARPSAPLSVTDSK